MFDRLLTVGDVHVADDPGHYRLTEHRSQPLQVMSADRSLVEDGREFGPPARPPRPRKSVRRTVPSSWTRMFDGVTAPHLGAGRHG
ncbi:MAG TPA: hypothetical protein DDZ64_04120 [Acidimicrobiaceae bacterium]|nr:hypothetical protein [Acidimicrobiaceae bacterium]